MYIAFGTTSTLGLIWVLRTGFRPTTVQIDQDDIERHHNDHQERLSKRLS